MNNPNCADRSSSRNAAPVAGASAGDGSSVSRGQFDSAELERISENWGAQFADVLITDYRWPTCNQPAAIRAAGLVVQRAIAGIVAILDVGADFKPHTKMMAETIHKTFWNAMPNQQGRKH